ncbi:MAG: DOMON-like domain-containing protein [Bdellovibrionota bacterium]
MEKLLPFTPRTLSFSVAGSIHFAQGRLHLRYELLDPRQEVVGGLEPGTYEGSAVSRADGLWQSTCFEAFWGIEKSAAYWELNLAPSGRSWNLYRFEGYRVPQPPQPSEDFALEKITIRGGQLDCILVPNISLTRIDASLCAVVKTATATEYLASAHAGAKPDFHLRSSFRLGASE